MPALRAEIALVEDDGSTRPVASVRLVPAGRYYTLARFEGDGDEQDVLVPHGLRGPWLPLLARAFALWKKRSTLAPIEYCAKGHALPPGAKPCPQCEAEKLNRRIG